jgi:hypothetical protein
VNRNDPQHNTIISIRGEETKRKENNLLYKVATPLGHTHCSPREAPKAPFPNNMGYYYRVS